MRHERRERNEGATRVQRVSERECPSECPSSERPSIGRRASVRASVRRPSERPSERLSESSSERPGVRRAVGLRAVGLRAVGLRERAIFCSRRARRLVVGDSTPGRCHRCRRCRWPARLSARKAATRTHATGEGEHRRAQRSKHSHNGGTCAAGEAAEWNVHMQTRGQARRPARAPTLIEAAEHVNVHGGGRAKRACVDLCGTNTQTESEDRAR